MIKKFIARLEIIVIILLISLKLKNGLIWRRQNAITSCGLLRSSMYSILDFTIFFSERLKATKTKPNMVQKKNLIDAICIYKFYCKKDKH